MNLSPEDYNRLHAFYLESLKEYGPTDARSVQWASDFNQQIRFDALIKIADLKDQSILDFGCGIGDLYKFLLKKEIPLLYSGIDIIPEFIETARARFPDTPFFCEDIFKTTKTYDYILSSGAMSFKVTDNKDFYKDIIKKLYSLSRKGLAFNMLDSTMHIDDETYAAYSPKEIDAFCRTLSPNVEVVMNYFPDDFTIYMYKENP